MRGHTKEERMSIEDIIPAEVTNDNFYSTLVEVATRADLKNFLEIGSSSGAGSTQALVNGLLKRPNSDARLFCLELSRTRFLNLVQTYSGHDFVIPLQPVFCKDLGIPNAPGSYPFLSDNQN